MIDQVKITVIATGFSEDKVRSSASREAVEALPDVFEGNGAAESDEETDELDIPAFMRQR